MFLNLLAIKQADRFNRTFKFAINQGIAGYKTMLQKSHKFGNLGRVLVLFKRFVFGVAGINGGWKNILKDEQVLKMPDNLLHVFFVAFTNR